MLKKEAFALLGVSTPSEAAKRLRISVSAVSQWPDAGDLPRSAEDKVLAQLARERLPAAALRHEGTPAEAAGSSST